MWETRVNQLNCKNYDFERYDAMKRSGAGGWVQKEKVY